MDAVDNICLLLLVIWNEYCVFYRWFIYPAIFQAVRLLPKNSVKAKKLDGRSTARKRPIGKANNQWGEQNSPLIKVSLYNK